MYERATLTTENVTSASVKGENLFTISEIVKFDSWPKTLAAKVKVGRGLLGSLQSRQQPASRDVGGSREHAPHPEVSHRGHPGGWPPYATLRVRVRDGVQWEG